MELSVTTTELSYSHIYMYIYINKDEFEKTDCLGEERNIRSCSPIFTPSFVLIERNEPTNSVDFMLRMEIYVITREIFAISVIIVCGWSQYLNTVFPCIISNNIQSNTTIILYVIY